MVLLRGVDIATIAQMVTAFRANGLLPRVGFSREDGGWPLSRPEPAFWPANTGPLVVFAVVDPVDATGKPSAFRAEAWTRAAADTVRAAPSEGPGGPGGRRRPRVPAFPYFSLPPPKVPFNWRPTREILPLYEPLLWG